MPIESGALTALQARTKPPAAFILQVDWSSVLTSYYADRAYHEIPPFSRIGWNVEPRLMGQNSNIENVTFDLQPDLRTEQIPLTFDDLDKNITGKFQTYGSGVRCEIWFYFPADDPDDDILVSQWFGTLKAPNIFGWKNLQTVATNGFRSREFTLPSSLRPRECRTKAFGGRLPTLDAVRTNVCPYDLHLGGTTGIVDPATSQPFLDCPRRSLADCSARFGHSRFFGGYNTDASATVSNQQGYLAVSKGNQSALKQPIRVIAGTKYVRGMQLMLWRRELGAQDPNHNWVATVWEVGEGPIRGIRNIKVNELTIQQLHLDPRLGTRGQPPVSNYNAGGTISNFSGIAHYSARYGWVNALDYSPSNLASEAVVDGYREVAIYNPTAAGNGLLGTYYNDTTFSAQIAQRIDYQINFPSNQNPPLEGLNYHTWSCRWTGRIKPEYTETYTFTGQFDDKMKLIVNGVTLFDGTVYTDSPLTGSIALTANTEYTIQIDFVQGPGSAYNPWFCILQWSSVSQTLEVVPNDRLYHDGGSGSVRQWTNDRIWWLLECHTSNRFGLAYPISRFWVDDFIDASNWGIQEVNFQHTHPDGEVETYSGRRTTFEASLEGRAAIEQIEDICRSGAISVPFQYEGKFTIAPFRAFTSGELSAAPIFTDTGETRNIIWQDGQPSIYLEKIPDEVLINEIILTFEEQDNFDTERPITIDDPDQKLKAGRQLGEDNLQTVPKRFAAFGIRQLQESVRLGRRLLKFGEFDEGGTHNNLKARFFAPLERCLNLKRYGPIEIVSQLLDGHESPEGDPFEYFRILNLKKVANGLVEIRCVAYNQTAYEAHETTTAPAPAPPSPTPPTTPGPGPNPCELTIGTVTYNSATGFIEVPIEPC
jgi:hypothetical protein